MRKIIFFLLLLIGLLACRREDVQERSRTYKLPTDYFFHSYDSNFVEYYTTHVHFSYNNRLLTRMDNTSRNLNTGDSSQTHCEYIYSNENRGELSRVKVYENNIFVKYKKYTYANEKLIRIEEFDAQTDSLEKTIEFTYNGDLVSTMHSESRNGLHGRIEMFTFDGQNPVNIKGYFSSDPGTLIYEYNYQYDNKFHPEKNILTKRWPIKSQNNKTLWRIDVYIGNGYSGEVYYTYTYDRDNFPVRRVKTNENGDTLNIAEIYYNL